MGGQGGEGGACHEWGTADCGGGGGWGREQGSRGSGDAI